MFKGLLGNQGGFQEVAILLLEAGAAKDTADRGQDLLVGTVDDINPA